MTKLTTVLISCGALLAACGEAKPAKEETSRGEPRTGVWSSQGYGYVVEAREGNISLYHLAGTTCLRDESLNQSKTTFEALGLEVLAQDHLLLSDSTAKIEFQPLSELPDACSEAALLNGSDDPQDSFDVVWQNINEHFPFLDVVDVDWEEAQATRSQVIDEASLFSTLVNQLAPLRDGHMTLSNGKESFEGAHARLSEALQPQFESQELTDDFDEYLEDAIDLNVGAIFDNYVEAQGTGANEKVYWGVMEHEIGYIIITQMLGFSQDEESLLAAVGDLGPSADLLAAEHQAIAEAIDLALEDLAKVEGLVLDLRFNTGGIDSASRIIASRFADQERLAYRKATYFEGELLPPLDFKVAPTDNAWTKPVRVLSSPLTASGAEVFLLTMREFPHVELLGQRSLGALSDLLEKPLPLKNWSFTLSNEVYSSPDGEVYEFVGVPVDTEVPVFVPKELLSVPAQDLALEAAATQLREAQLQ